eukprot:GEMP01066230.1.p1 GENE.GEMP01066230.1~~GEMP01066230.1.p1  ORF type:complete len:264 (+),score=46.06 GEMP01066230.1:258-1049(+)
MVSSRCALCIFVLQVGAELELKIADDAGALIGADLLDEAHELAVTTNVVSKAPKQPNYIPVSLIDASGTSARTQPESPVVNAAPEANANKARPDSSLADSGAEKNDPSATDEQQGPSNPILLRDKEDQLVPAQSENLKTEDDDKATSQPESSEGDEDDVAAASSVLSQGASAIKGYDEDDDDDGGAAHGQVPLMIKRTADSATAAPTINGHDQTFNDDHAASRFFISVHQQKFAIESKWAVAIGVVVTVVIVSFAASMVRDRE